MLEEPVLDDEDSLGSNSDSSDDSYDEEEIKRAGGLPNANLKGICKGHWSKEEVNFKRRLTLLGLATM